MVAVTRRSLGFAVRTAREAAGLTQDVLAKRSGVAQSTISQLEQGEARPRIDTLASLAKAIGLPLWELVKQAETAGGAGSGELEWLEDNGGDDPAGEGEP